jgi:hypothetical protein
MAVYSGPVFDMAASRFNAIADHVDGNRAAGSTRGLFP